VCWNTEEPTDDWWEQLREHDAVSQHCVGGWASNTCMGKVRLTSHPHGAVRYQGTPTHLPTVLSTKSRRKGVGGVNRMRISE